MRARDGAEKRNGARTMTDDEVTKLRVSLADADLILEERERQLTVALTAVAAERARCAAVCREVACFYDGGDIGSVVALACADAIERGT